MLGVSTDKTEDGLGSGWDRLEHQERSREPLRDSQYGGERTGKVSSRLWGVRGPWPENMEADWQVNNKEQSLTAGTSWAALQKTLRKEGKAVAQTIMTLI